jgi:hypothetical protein
MHKQDNSVLVEVNLPLGLVEYLPRNYGMLLCDFFLAKCGPISQSPAYLPTH